MVIAVAAVLVPAAVVHPALAIRAGVPLEHVARDVLVADAADARGHARERVRDDLVTDAKRLEDLRSVVRRDGGDAHLRHDLEDAGVDGLLVLPHHLGDGALTELALVRERSQCLEREVRVHGARAEADERGEVMHVARVAGLGDEAGAHPAPAADQLVVHRRDGEQHRDRRPLLVHHAVGDDEDGVPLVDGELRHLAQLVEGALQPLGAIGRREARVQCGEAEVLDGRASQRRQLLVDHQRAREVHQPRRLGRCLQQRGTPPEVRVERHHDLLADRVDRGVRHLREALLEVRVEQAARVLQRGQRGVVPHRPGRLLAVLGHGLDDVLDLFVSVAMQHLQHVHVLFRTLADVAVAAVHLGVEVVAGCGAPSRRTGGGRPPRA